MAAPLLSSDPPKPLAWEPDGHWVAFSPTGEAVEVEWVGPGHAEKRIAHLAVAGRVSSLSISRDSRWLACGCNDGAVLVWQIDLERSSDWVEASRGRLGEGATAAVPSPALVAFSPFDDTLAVARGEQVLLLRVDAAALRAAAVAAASSPTPVSAGNETPRVSTLVIRLEDGKLAFRASVTQGWIEVNHDRLDRTMFAQVLSDVERIFGKSVQPPPATRVAEREGLLLLLRSHLLPRGLLESGPLASDDAPLGLAIGDELTDLPWELVLGAPDQVPLGVTRGLVRQVPREPSGPMARSGIALVVACPRTNAAGEDPSLMRSAPEADAVADAIERAGLVVGVQRLRRPGAQELVEALLRGTIRLLFIAGDGTAAGGPSPQPYVELGVAIEPGFALTSHEFVAMQAVPELVFLSCGRLSRMAPGLIREGVRVVVAPLWNVEDAEAATFSTSFFEALLGGVPLVWATQRARAATYAAHPDSAAWAAFQIHGDPDFRFLKQESPAPAESPPAETVPAEAPAPIASTIDVDLSNLLLPSKDQQPADRVLRAEPGDLVSLEIANGPVLTVSLESAQDLVTSAQAAPTTASQKPGFLGGVMLSAVKLLSGGAESDPAAVLEIARRADAAVEPGVYSLSPDALEPLKGSGRRLATMATASEPILVLVHGLMADTASTFGKLWQQHPQLVAALFGRYRDQVFALESATLALGPIRAALTLVQALPPGARVDLLTHASGGLVGEILARCGAETDPAGSADLDAADRESLRMIAATMAERKLRVERTVRVACPVRGTLLLSNRVDVYMSVVHWARQLVGMTAPAEAGALTLAAARHPEALRALPGIAAIAPDAALIRWLNSAGSVAGDLRVIAGNVQGDNVVSWVKTLLVDTFYQGDNDLLVPTASMFGGVRRSGTCLFLLDQGKDASHFNYFANPRTANAAVRALLEPSPAEFAPIGPLSMAGQSSAGSN